MSVKTEKQRPESGRAAVLYAEGISEVRGATDKDLEKPLVAIANTWNEILPGLYHLDRIAAAVKRGIRDAGGMATIFNVLAPCDGQGSGNEGFKYVLPRRDLIASSVEMMIEHASYDAAVMIGTCDKIVPGLIMAAARCNLPTVLVTGGYMPAGHYKGERLDCSSMGKYFVMSQAGENRPEELLELEDRCLSRSRRLLSHGHGQQHVHCRGGTRPFAPRKLGPLRHPPRTREAGRGSGPEGHGPALEKHQGQRHHDARRIP